MDGVMLTRREWLHGAAGACLGFAAPAEGGCTLSIGTYSLKGLALDDAIEAVAAIGYDGVEIAVIPGHDAEPAKLNAAARRDLRRRLAGRLALTALMENLSPATDAKRHQADLDRLRRVVDLSNDLAPARPPLVQTVLGGGTWDDKKALFRDRLGDWAGVFREGRVVLAIKPHRGGALSRPSEAAWLIAQLGDPPWLRMVYDYSHYAHRDMTVASTVREALPVTAHVVVKDAVQVGDKVEFRLPGESGTFDYAALLRLWHAGGYRGDVCCEVSSQVSSKPGFDPVAAAQVCYRSMARAFVEAKVARG